MIITFLIGGHRENCLAVMFLVHLKKVEYELPNQLLDQILGVMLKWYYCFNVLQTLSNVAVVVC